MSRRGYAMKEISHERYIEARCEQVWMLVDDAGCRSRWLVCGGEMSEVVVHEYARKVCWTARAGLAPGAPSRLEIELESEGAGTRVRILAAPGAGRMGALTIGIGRRRALRREIRLSLEQLAGMLAGRSGT